MTAEVPQAYPSRQDRSALWLGLAVLVLGILALIGHAMHNRPMLQLVPGQDLAIVLSAGLCLVLSGAGLIASRGAARQQRAAAILIGIATALAISTLAEHALGINMGIDWPSLHGWVAGGSRHPGRMGLDTALGFLGFGAAYFLSRGTPTRFRFRLTRWMIGFVLLLGVVGILGHFLTIDFLYTNPIVSRIAMPSALGLVLLGTGLLRELRNRDWYRALNLRPFGDQLAVDAEILLVAVAAAAGLVAFAVMQGRLERLVSLQLDEQLEDRANFVANTLSQVEERTAMIATRPGVGQTYSRIAADPNDTAARDALEGIARSFLPHGFTAIRFLNREGVPIAAIGSFRSQPQLTVRLKDPEPIDLLWDEGYYLRLSKPVIWNGVMLGRVLTEQPMTSLTRLSANAMDWVESGEVALCGAALTVSPDDMACFPTRFESRPFISPKAPPGDEIPMARALNGEVGMSKVIDRRRQWVLAGYRPVGASGLGMVMKIDLEEIFRPIRQGFQVILPLLVLLVIAGAMLLRWRLQPVLARMADAQRAVVESENRFRIASESGVDAFLILESVRSGEGKVVDFLFSYVNRNAEKMLGHPRTHLLNQSLSNAVPTLVQSGWLDRYKKVVDSGRPSDAEHSVEFPDIAATWVHQHIVPLGDGVAVTVTDISERKRLEHDLRRMAQSDALTQIPNRALFLDRLEMAMIRTRGGNDLLGILAIDIDHFQALNRDWGHASGDAVLKVCAARLTEGIRLEDTVGRIDSDGFAVILEGLNSRSQAFGAAEAMLKTLQQEITLAEHRLRITASIGIALYSGEKTTAAILLERAVTALSEVQHRGGNGYFASEASYARATDSDQTGG